MGLKVLWIVFGAAVFYVIATVLVPILIVVLRRGGIDLGEETAANLTRLAALLAAAVGGAVGLHHMQKVEAQRSEG